ncbi:MAG TPA: dephospho-CoA kinase [Candidatus Binataceae bacterium]|jgi:dephospho-CoA kinase|nr:dephospho-CoA kinase [Candidatus Binataceae bacterium]
MLTIGLTGGIGSGKSTVAKMLAELGAPSFDADKVGHEIYSPDGPAYHDVVAAFGSAIVAADGTIDRKKLGPIVFADPAQLKRLESIVHPRMFERMGEMVAEMRAKGATAPIVVEAAILIEAHWQPLFDEIWLVVAPREKVVQRVELERGLKPEQTEARIKAQLSDDERRKHSTIVIDNGGTIDELRGHVSSLWLELLERNKKRGKRE